MSRARDDKRRNMRGEYAARIGHEKCSAIYNARTGLLICRPGEHVTQTQK